MLWNWYIRKRILGDKGYMESATARKEMMEEMIREQLEEDVRNGEVGAKELFEEREKKNKQYLNSSYANN